jgi:hypothetical protein
MPPLLVEHSLHLNVLGRRRPRIGHGSEVRSVIRSMSGSRPGDSPTKSVAQTGGQSEEGYYALSVPAGSGLSPRLTEKEEQWDEQE